MGERNTYHRRLPEWEPFDEIKMRIQPRYKTSEMSGDEWRQTIMIDFYFKGVVVKSFTARTMQIATMLLGSFFFNEEGLSKEYLAREEETCDQPGCKNKAIARLRLIKLTADNGDWLDMKEQYGDYYRKFCSEHIQRGDCGREDADDNYIPLDGKSAEDSTNTKKSPSILGGVIEVIELNQN